MPEIEATYQKAWRLRQALDAIIADLDRAKCLKTLEYTEAAPLATKIEADAATRLKAVETEINEATK